MRAPYFNPMDDIANLKVVPARTVVLELAIIVKPERIPHCYDCGIKLDSTVKSGRCGTCKVQFSEEVPDYGFGICQQDDDDRSPDCTRVMRKTRSQEQSICLLCMQYLARARGRNSEVTRYDRGLW